MNRQLLAVCGSGLIGHDPLDRRTWSGSSYFFCTELRRLGALRRAFGVEAPGWRRWLRIAANFHPDRRLWRERFYLDTGYYDDLTREIGRRLTPDDFRCDFLQFGALYDVPALAAGRARCFSYHDGNLAETLRSPYAPKGLGARAIDRALAHERRVYHGLDRIFSMSEYLRQSFIRDFDVPPGRVVNVGAGVNLERLPDHQPDKSYETREVLFIGVDFPRKGGRQLLQAFRGVRGRVPGARLHVVGPRRLDVPAGLLDGVTLHGFLRKTDPRDAETLAGLFRRCCLFVMPSLYEPFGIAPLEAMAHQLPCVLTRRWALEEMVAPGETGELVGCGDVDELEAKIAALLPDAPRLRRMGDAARESVLGRYTWDRVARRVVDAIAPALPPSLPPRVGEREGGGALAARGTGP